MAASSGESWSKATPGRNLSISRSTPSPARARTSAVNSSSVTPGRGRPLRRTAASEGMTLRFIPASSRVGAQVFAQHGVEHAPNGRLHGQLTQGLLHPRRVEQIEQQPTGLGPHGPRRRLEEGGHRGRDAVRQPAAEPGLGGAEVHDGVVVVGHGAVTGPPPGDEVDVGAAFLRHLAGVDRPAVDDDGKAAGLVDPVLGVQPLRVVGGDPAHPVDAPALLVGGGDHHQVPLQGQLLPVAHEQGLQVHGGGELGVDGAAAVEDAAGDLSGEGRVAPALRLDRHHVEVGHHQQGALGAVAPQAHGEAGALLAGLQDLGLQALGGELRGEVAHQGPLVPGRVGGVEAQHLLQAGDGLGAGREGGHRRLSKRQSSRGTMAAGSKALPAPRPGHRCRERTSTAPPWT